MDDFFSYANELSSRQAIKREDTQQELNTILKDQQRDQFIENVGFPASGEIFKGLAKSETGQKIIKGGLKKFGVDDDELVEDLTKGDFQEAFRNKVSRIIDSGIRRANQNVETLNSSANEALEQLSGVAQPSSISTQSEDSELPTQQNIEGTTTNINRSSLNENDTFRDIINDPDKFNEWAKNQDNLSQFENNDLETLRQGIIQNPEESEQLFSQNNIVLDERPSDLTDIISRTNMLDRPAEETGGLRGDSTIARALRMQNPQPRNSNPQGTQEGITPEQEERPVLGQTTEERGLDETAETAQETATATGEAAEEAGEGAAEGALAEVTEASTALDEIPILGPAVTAVLGLATLGTSIASIFDFGHHRHNHQITNPSQQFGV